MLATENQVNNIILQLYGVQNRENTESLEILFMQSMEIGLYHVDIIKARVLLRAGNATLKEVGHNNQIVYFRRTLHVGRMTRLPFGNVATKIAIQIVRNMIQIATTTGHRQNTVTPSLPELLDEEGYPASDVIMHSAETEAYTVEKNEVVPAIRQALRTKVAGVQVQAGIIESSTRFREKLIGDHNNKVSSIAREL